MGFAPFLLRGEARNKSKAAERSQEGQRQERRTEPALSEVEGSVRPTHPNLQSDRA